MEIPLLVIPPVGMGTETVPQTLDQTYRHGVGVAAVIIGEGGRKSGDCQPMDDAAAYNLPPISFLLGQCRGKLFGKHQIGAILGAVERLGNRL